MKFFQFDYHNASKTLAKSQQEIYAISIPKTILTLAKNAGHESNFDTSDKHKLRDRLQSNFPETGQSFSKCQRRIKENQGAMPG